jgi:DNA-binding CsgD family transcriptional regulator
MDFICNPERGLAFRLAESHRIERRQSSVVDGLALKALLGADLGRADGDLLHNIVIHRARLLSGATYSFVLVNVPEFQLERCQQLFKLVSTHLKMALSRAVAKPQTEKGACLTRRELEIVQWMSKGKSNREISALLGISAITLKNHVSKLYRKLDVQNRAEAVARGLALPVSTQAR